MTKPSNRQLERHIRHSAADIVGLVRRYPRRLINSACELSLTQSHALIELHLSGMAAHWTPVSCKHTLAVELACAGQLKPGLKVFGAGAAQQGSLGVATVVELGFGTDTRAQART